MKKKQRNTLFAIIFIVSVIFVVGILFPQALVDLNGNGEPSYEPSTEYSVGTPVLNEISPEVDYDGSILIDWEDIVSGYDITGYYIFRQFNSGNWICIKSISTGSHYYDSVQAEGFYDYRVMGIAIIEEEEHLSQYSNEESVQVSFTTSNIPVLKPLESPNIDGIINLDWNEVEVLYHQGYISGYNIYRHSALEGWKKIGETLMTTTVYTDNINEDGEYEYFITSNTYINSVYESDPSNIRVVVVDIYQESDPPPEVLPQNPSIEINGGDETTDSFEISLTLSCDNAEKMQFQLDVGKWTNWTAYETTYALTLCEEYLFNDMFRIGVVFWNENGTSVDAGYTDIYDDITYEAPTQEEPPVEPANGKDYTLVYVLIGILGSLVGTGVFLKYRYRNRKNRKQVIKSN